MSDYSSTVEAYITELPPLALDSKFVLVYGPDTGVSFTGAELDVWISNCTDGTRLAHLTEADVVLSSTDTVATFTKAATWTSATLTAGQIDVLFFVNDTFYSHARFEAYTPCGGRTVPDAA